MSLAGFREVELDVNVGTTALSIDSDLRFDFTFRYATTLDSLYFEFFDVSSLISG